MRFKKVIYVRYMPLTEKIYNDFYMEEVTMVGIELEYWDLSNLFFKNIAHQEDSSFLTKISKFNTYKELEEAILDNQPLTDKLFISIMTFEGRVAKLYKLFTKYNCILAVFGRNMFPLPPRKLSVSYLLKKLNISSIRNYLKTKSILKDKAKGIIKDYDIVFLGGEKGWQGIGMINEADIKNSEVVLVNSDDYDNYLLRRNSEAVVNYPYILFLDEYLPLHPDTILFGIKNVTPEQYYPELNKYFKHVEKQFNMPVIIAPHPKAIKYRTLDFFNGRKVIFGKTSELTEHAHFVLAHDTTSINYPIAFGKKLHFITSKNISKYISIVHNNVMHFSAFLGCNVQWFDNEDELDLVKELPQDEYQKYKYLFQTSPETENILTKDIFIDFLKR